MCDNVTETWEFIFELNSETASIICFKLIFLTPMNVERKGELFYFHVPNKVFRKVKIAYAAGKWKINKIIWTVSDLSKDKILG